MSKKSLMCNAIKYFQMINQHTTKINPILIVVHINILTKISYSNFVNNFRNFEPMLIQTEPCDIILLL